MRSFRLASVKTPSRVLVGVAVLAALVTVESARADTVVTHGTYTFSGFPTCNREVILEGQGRSPTW